MTTELLSEKSDKYFSLFRSEIYDLIPRGTLRLLDVGCGTGELGQAAKIQLGVQEVIGIEIHEPVARIAGSKLDKVILGDVEQLQLDFEPGYFDCIVCADVLEHTIDPWQLLRRLSNLLSGDGSFIASIPNIRHIVPILKILFDRLEYEESGILDKTHLRFFTLHTAKKMLTDAGFDIQHMIRSRSNSWKFRAANAISFGLFREFSVYQYIFLANKSPQNTTS
jgi:2-polyprenyl-3-methyl-5-hydroxy-6-metoxy-1,4-benzoquinol methylase